MKSYTRSQLTDDSLLSSFDTRLSLDLDNIADLLADLAEIDARRLSVPAAYGSMFDFCVHAKHMSEDVALKRIRVARTGRQFPAIFLMLADGRLGRSAVLLLTPELTPVTADGLLSAAAGKTNAQIEKRLAERFPKPDVATSVRPITSAFDAIESSGASDGPTLQLAVRPVVPSDGPNVPLRKEPLPARRRPVPLSSGKYAVQLTMDEDMHEDLLAVQALLGHVLPSGDVAEVFRRAVRELRRKLEKQKFAKCARPRPQRGAAKGRHIPAAVKRAVCERDGDRCTFVSDQGKRCEARRALEFDHVEAFARGGESTIGNLRLRCRAHNQFEAECAFSAEFMAGKREQARERAARAKAESSARAKANAEAKARARAEAQSKANAEAEANAAAKARAAVEAASQKEVISWLRALGCNAERARQAAARCEGMADAPLETRVFVACQGLAPRSARRALPMASGPS